MDAISAKLGRDLEVDVLQLVVSRMAICANSGAGKSHALRLLVEQIAGRIPVHILDPEGEYVTLRTVVDAVLVSVDGGDIAPVPATAFRLAKRLREHQVSAILDLSELDRVGRLQFAAQYIQGLMASPRSSWRPTLVALDEAHRFAPEIVSRGGSKELVAAANACRAAVIMLMDSGAKRQLGGILATQRLSKVAKDALGQFLDWLREDKGITLCRWQDTVRHSDEIGDYTPEGYYMATDGIEKLLAAYFEIDMNVIEAERRAMLAGLQAENTL